MNLIGCYHAIPAFAFHSCDLTLQLLVPDEERNVIDVTLDYEVQGGKSGTVRMLPVDGILTEESFSVYAATIPAEALAAGDLLTYSFSKEKETGGPYTVPLSALPALPALTVTEHFPWGVGLCECMELYNPTERTVDLYDFELALVGEDGEVKKRNPMAARQGEHLLDGGEMGILSFLAPAMHVAAEGEITAERLLQELAERYPESCAELAERAPKVFLCEISEQNEKGEWVLAADRFRLYRWITPHTLCILPRGGNVEDAIFTMSLSPDKEHISVRRCRSSLWRVDPRAPHVGICTEARALPTPGFADSRQFVLDTAATTVPAILPLSPRGRVYLGRGDATIRFFVAGQATEPTVFLREGEKLVPYAAQMGNDGAFEVQISALGLDAMQGKLQYYIEVSGGLYTASLGSAEAPLSVRIVDNAGPMVTSVYPAEGQVLENETHPEIAVHFADGAGVNTRTSIFCLDGHNVSSAVRFEGNALYYRPQKALSLGAHVIEVSLRDTLGNRTYRKVTFSVSDGKELHCYRGEVHCHTIESDAEGTAEEALAYARDVGKADYFAVTDHSHYMTLGELRAQRALADTFNENGAYAPLHGFEMTWNFKTGFWGHMNVLNTDWIDSDIEGTGLYDLYEKLKKDPEAVAMFNHPEDAWGDFNEFDGWDPEIDARVCLAEIRGERYDRGYTLMLSKGWHAAPVANEDNHKKNWTTATTTTGYVLAPSLTRENVLEAFRRRRTYTTCDNTMKILYRVNGEWLGSRLQAPEKLTVEVEIRTENELGIGRLSLVTEDNIVVAQVNAGPLREFSWQIEIDPDFDYYYLRINNGKLYSVTAPVFVEGRDLLTITDLSHGVCADAAAPHAVDVTVRNGGDKPMRDVTVDFYLTPLAGFELRATVPFASVSLGELDAGKTHTVTRCFPTVPQNRRVTAVVHGDTGKGRFADTAYCLLTPVRIGKQLPLSAPLATDEGEIANPFPYVELYNPMPKDVKLDGYMLKYWHATGAAPLPERCLALDGYVIPAGGTLTVWVRSADSTLTVADFNTRYGTSLVENEDLIVTNAKIYSASDAGHRLDLTYRNEVISRVTYGRFCTKENDIAEDKPLLYGGFSQMSARQLPVAAVQGESTLPGTLVPAQIPAQREVAISREAAQEGGRSGFGRVITRLTKAPLVPLQAAKLIAGAVSALKGFFSKE